MVQYPVHFAVECHAGPGLVGTWESRAEGQSTRLAVPTAFEGSGGAASPEGHFANALLGCFVATFKVYAHYSKVPFASIDAQGDLRVEARGEGDRQVVMKSFTMRIAISGVDSIPRARAVAQKTFQSGFILNSVRTDLKALITLSSLDGAVESLEL